MKKGNAKNLRFAILASDTVLLTLRDGQLFVRLIPVHIPPYFNHLKGLPGGLIKPHETARQTVLRLLRDKAHISEDHVHVRQLHTFDAIKRDPRGRVVAVAYLSLVPWTRLSKEEQKDTDKTGWFPVGHLPHLAYDHKEIISVGLSHLKEKVTSTTLMGKLMPGEFTLTELEQAYEAIVGMEIDKRNFRKKILKLDVLKKLPYERRGQRSRPAQLYGFKSAAVMAIGVL